MSVTVVGNLTREPELRFTKNGKAVANIGIAVNRKRGETETTTFIDVTCWDTLAENIGSSLARGTRVVVVGELNANTWEDNDGNKRTKLEIVADDVAPSLRWATANVSKAERREAPAYVEDDQPF